MIMPDYRRLSEVNAAAFNGARLPTRISGFVPAPATATTYPIIREKFDNRATVRGVHAYVSFGTLTGVTVNLRKNGTIIFTAALTSVTLFKAFGLGSVLTGDTRNLLADTEANRRLLRFEKNDVIIFEAVTSGGTSGSDLTLGVVLDEEQPVR